MKSSSPVSKLQDKESQIKEKTHEMLATKSSEKQEISSPPAAASLTQIDTAKKLASSTEKRSIFNFITIAKLGQFALFAAGGAMGGLGLPFAAGGLLSGNALLATQVAVIIISGLVLERMGSLVLGGVVNAIKHWRKPTNASDLPAVLAANQIINAAASTPTPTPTPTPPITHGFNNKKKNQSANSSTSDDLNTTSTSVLSSISSDAESTATSRLSLS